MFNNLLHQFPSCIVLASLLDTQGYFSAEMLSDKLAFRLSISQLLDEDNTGFTFVAIFELNVKLQKRVKKILGGYSGLSFIYFIPSCLF